jgi:glutamate dehydrogenase
LLESVLERIGDLSEPLAAFARAYLRRVPWDAAMTPDTAFHEVAGLFRFIERRSGAIDVRVLNPTLDTDGYEAAGTVVEIRVDDGPFLVDSVTAELQAYGLAVVRVLHPVIGTTRDESGRLLSVDPAGRSPTRESVQHYVLDRRLEPVDHPALEARLESVLGDVLLAVRDFATMVEATKRMVSLARGGEGRYPQADVDEAVTFLEWLPQDNFVFLGYREYRIVDVGDDPALGVVADSGLGILSDPSHSKAFEPVPLASLPAGLRARFEQGDLLVVSKTNQLSSVHRRARMDYVGVRILGPRGETVGEARLLGLFTSKAYMESVTRVPLLRQKLAEITSGEDLIEGSHDHKAIVALMESFPKDELFGLPTDDLHQVLMGLLALQERAQVRLFVRRELLDRGVRVMVAMPRDRYSADLRRRLQDLLQERFDGISVDYHLALDRTDVARLHFIVWVSEDRVPDVAFAELEADVMTLARSWAERVAEVLSRRHGEHRAEALVARWAPRLPAYYTASTELNVAAGDIERLDELTRGGRPSLVGMQNVTEGEEVLTRVALYEREGKRALSELTPALEDMGMEVVEEVPTRLSGDEELFIHDFGVLDSGGDLIDIDDAGARVARALAAVWEGEAESDSLNRLVLTTGLDHLQVAILRAYQTYWRRVSPTFTVRYVNDTLVAHSDITSGLMRLFELRFDPASDGVGYAELRDELLVRLDEVLSLDEDRILRGFLRLIEATVRTSAYRADRGSLAFKLRSADVPNMPSPRPEVEVFVIGEEVEGIHLRAGLRARGGIRWSDRREDYRTEVLGLMKAQVTKNAIIVPTGAKGGFVLRRPPRDPEGMAEAVRSAYDTFIRGLLDVTDNLVGGEVIHPAEVRIHDGDDPYLVVAADKGTARFSDLANRIAREYGFWLDDAFASGGATGFDHKGLGITARGAWKSLERHFLQQGIDPHSQTFTAVGIGDMSGDVFGNGMLGSETIRLVAAFDHRHVFIDPNPDPTTSFRERKRLYELPRSSWDDYNRDLLSGGGGVFSRAAKQVKLSEQARAALGTTLEAATPAELIQTILRAPVDLLWTGGIGTFVKASGETDEQAGDRVNDPVRINGAEVRARVVVEGGNLAFTQRGRIEYARAGGNINTDFIDNSGGVNCSDREVNLKILLRLAEERGEIGPGERHQLMAGEAGNVVDAVLYDSLEQAQLLAREELASADRIDAYEQLMASLEASALLDRDLEWLPSTQEMAERERAGTGLTRPELAVLLAYAKRSLAEEILASHLPDSVYMLEDLTRYFPGEISKRFGHLVWEHPLRRELIATIVANDVVDSQGPTFVSRMVARTGAEVAAVVAAYRNARELVGGKERRRAVEDLFGLVDHRVWNEMMATNHRLVATLTRWYLEHAPGRFPDEDIAAAADICSHLEEEEEERGPGQWRFERDSHVERLISAGVPPTVARRSAASLQLVHAPDIIEVAEATGRSPLEVADVFHNLGHVLELDDLERVVAGLKLTDPWQRWARQTIEDDILSVRRLLAERVLAGAEGLSMDEAVEQFLASRVDSIVWVAELVRSLEPGAIDDTAPLLVVVRQLQNLAGSPSSR